MDYIEQRLSRRARHARRYWSLARSGAYNDDPGKIETDAQGQVVKEPPPSFSHKALQWRIQQLLSRVLPGVAVTEFPVATHEGTKLPDVAWLESETWNEAIADDMSLPVPRICVEVLSPSNTEAEMHEKRRLYFKVGVEEVWICDPDGKLSFYDSGGMLETSRMVPSAPKQVSGTVPDE